MKGNNVFLIQDCNTGSLWSFYDGYKFNLAGTTALPKPILDAIGKTALPTLQLCRLQSDSRVILISIPKHSTEEVKGGIDSNTALYKKCTESLKDSKSIFAVINNDVNEKKITPNLWYALRTYTLLLKLTVWEQSLKESSTEEEDFTGAAKWVSAIRGTIGASVNNPLDLDWR